MCFVCIGNESPAQIASAKREKDILKELLLKDANPNTVRPYLEHILLSFQDLPLSMCMSLFVGCCLCYTSDTSGSHGG